MISGPTYVVYARKSSESEERQMLSIPAQLRELRELASRRGLSIAEELTESCSAREPGRPVFSVLLGRIAKGNVHGVLCWKLDRLSRNPIDAGALTHYLGKGLLHEILTPEGAYTGTSDAKFTLAVLFGTATKYTDDLSQAVKRGNRSVYERGRIPAVPPLGYIKVSDPTGGCETGKVVPDPERFAMMKRVWQELATGGVTVAEMWRRATAWGLSTRPTRKHPSHPVTLSHLYHLLASRFYAGEIVRDGRVYSGEHESMITPEGWERVQRHVRRTDGPRPSKRRFLYSGLLHCGTCGRLLVGEAVRNRHGAVYTYFRCGRRRQGFERCLAPAPSDAAVSSDIEAALARHTIPAAFADWTMSAVEAAISTERQGFRGRIKALEAERARIDADLRRASALVVSGTLTEPDYVALREELAETRTRVARTLAEPEAEQDEWRRAVAEVVTAGTTALDRFRSGDAEDKRHVLCTLYENLVVTDRKTAPVLRFPFTLLDAPRGRRPAFEGRDENPPQDDGIAGHTGENALRSGARLDPSSLWWAKVLEVRTLLAKRAKNGNASPQATTPRRAA